MLWPLTIPSDVQNIQYVVKPIKKKSTCLEFGHG